MTALTVDRPRGVPVTRCALCDQPSDAPVCARCSRVLTEERFGPLRGLWREGRR